MENKLETLFWLIYAICTFLVFAYDIENDRDYYTWMWLLSSIIGFKLSLYYLIKDLIKK